MKMNVEFSRDIDFENPFELHYRIAEGHFMKLWEANNTNGSAKPQIKSIDVVFNKKLEDKFEAKRQEFKEKKIPHNPILAFHGTQVNNVDSILK